MSTMGHARAVDLKNMKINRIICLELEEDLFDRLIFAQRLNNIHRDIETSIRRVGPKINSIISQV